jgi:hypothetical protein
MEEDVMKSQKEAEQQLREANEQRQKLLIERRKVLEEKEKHNQQQRPAPPLQPQNEHHPQWIVHWTDVPGVYVVGLGQMKKYDPHEFLRDGDTVRAACDLDYPDLGLVKKGQLGVLGEFSNTHGAWFVDWGGFPEKVVVKKDQVNKCAPHEFLREGDMVRAACDLDYPDLGLVKKGQLGMLCYIGGGV